MPPPQSPKALTLDCLSRRLLDHDGLMTPVLLEQFGILTVVQTGSQHIANRFLRHSSIYQAATGEKILDAALDISLQSLPIGFFERLQHQDVLFGQLLRDFFIDVCIMDRTLFQSESDGAPRWGRRLSIHRRNTLELISKVEELMVSDAQLWPMRCPSSNDLEHPR